MAAGTSQGSMPIVSRSGSWTAKLSDTQTKVADGANSLHPHGTADLKSLMKSPVESKILPQAGLCSSVSEFTYIWEESTVNAYKRC